MNENCLGNGLLIKKLVEKGDGIETRAERGQEITLGLKIYSKTGGLLYSNDSFTFILADKDVPDVSWL